MCGIAGLMRLDGRPIEPETLEGMAAALAHRGPDAQGVHHWSADRVRVGFAHTRLKIIDLSAAAAQPMTNEDGSVGIVFNGEIYNYQALRRRLEARGARFRSASDTEVILRLYEAEGTEAIPQLDGMFALAIWDARSASLLLARDRVGKKPLFVHVSDRLIAFASEIKALRAIPDIPLEVNRRTLPAYFVFGYVPAPDTIYEGIHQLGPGEWMVIGADGRRHRQSYWDVTRSWSPAMRRSPSDGEAAGRVRELVTAAVERRLIADVPLGAFLSGGIDSTIIVGVMSRLRQEPVQTFSIGFPGQPRFDETRYARLAAARFHTRHTEFLVEPSAVELIDRLVYHHDGPFGDSSAIPTYLLSRLTREHVTVALNGDGGDEVFAGYLRFAAAVWCERVPPAIRATLHRLLGTTGERGAHRSLWRRVQKFAGSAALPFEQRFSRWVSICYEDLPQLLPDGGGAEMLARVLEPVAETCRQAGDASDLTRLLYLNLNTYLLNDLLVKMDRCAMAHGLEARSPFLDRDLIEYVFALPDAMKLRWGRTKFILRRAFADLLPPAIARRGKMGFGVPLQAWFAGDLRAYVHDILCAPDARLRAFADHRYVLRLWDAHVRGEADHAQRLWALLTFEVWLRQGLRRSTALTPSMSGLAA